MDKIFFITALLISLTHAETTAVPGDSLPADSVFSQAQTAYRQNDYERCIDLLMEYRDLAGTNYALEYYLGMSFYRLGYWKWAAIHLERAREMEQIHEDAILYVLYQIYENIGHMQGAAERYKLLIEKYPNSSYTRSLMKAADRKKTSAPIFTFNGAMGTVYHSDLYGLPTADTTQPPKQSGFLYEASSIFKLKLKEKYSLNLSVLHDNALEKGIQNFTSLCFNSGIASKSVSADAGVDASLYDADIQAGRLSLSLDYLLCKSSSIYSGWSWQMWPDHDWKNNHFITTGVKFSLRSIGKFSAGIDAKANYIKTPPYFSNNIIGIAYVSGAATGSNTQTAFYEDANYNLQITPVRKEIIPGNRFLTYNDFPDSLFISENVNRWLVLPDQVPYSYLQGQLGISGNLIVTDFIIAYFTPRLSVQHYTENYKWYIPPYIIDPLTGLDISPVKDENGYLWTSNPIEKKCFVVYKNQEDGQYYYRRVDGKYYPVEFDSGNKKRIDWGIALPLTLSFTVKNMISFNLTYIYSFQKSNLPEDAPVVADYSDHSANLQINFYLSK